MNPKDQIRVYYRMADGGSGAGGGAAPSRPAVAPPPAATGSETATSADPTAGASAAVPPAAPTAAAATSPSRRRRAEQTAVAIVDEALATIARHDGWALPLLARDVVGPRDRGDVVVGHDEKKSDPERMTGNALGVQRTRSWVTTELRPVKTVTYELHLSVGDALMLGEDEGARVCDVLCALAGTVRGAQIWDATKAAGTNANDAQPLDADSLGSQVDQLARPVALIALDHRARGLEAACEALEVEFLDARALKLVLPVAEDVVALLVSRDVVPTLRYLGHDAECQAKFGDDGLDITVTERRAFLRMTEATTVSVIPLTSG